MYKLVSPISVVYYVTKKGEVRTLRLSMNVYNKTKLFVSNQAKIAYKKLMKDQIDKLPVFTKVKLHYKLFMKSNRPTDVMNFVAVVDKFFEDALVELGKLPDDNFNYVPVIVAEWGGVDKNNPRMEIEIIPIEPSRQQFFK